MAFDIYSPAVLNRVIQDLKSQLQPPFLLDTFFAEASVSPAEEIFFDVMTGKPRLSPFVSPLVEGQIVESLGYVTKSFKPAYIKDKRVLEDGKAVRRPAGAPIAGPIDPLQNRMMMLAQNSEDQIEMLQRRLEWMAATVLRTGQLTITGEKYPTVVLDFGRDASLSVVLSGNARWNDASPTPIDDLENWAGLVRDVSGARVTDVIMSQTAWTSFRSNQKVQDLLSRYLGLSLRTETDIGPDYQTLGVTDKGTIGDYHIWIYHGIYTDDTGATAKYLPDDYVLLLSPDIEGVQHFGAIRDESAGFQATDYYQKSWTQPDPAVRYLMLQSAPLVVPYRINGCLAAKVQ